MITPSSMPANISIRLNHVSATCEAADERVDLLHGAYWNPSRASIGPLGSGTLNHTSNMRKKPTIVADRDRGDLRPAVLAEERMKSAMKITEAS
jgi:hypothetical protein